MQGITTFVGGNCGIALAPVRDRSYFDATRKAWNLDLEPAWTSFGEFLGAVEAGGLAVNYLPLAGHNAIRGAVLGTDYQRPSRPEEVEQLKDLLAEALDSGCFGLSVGLDAATPGHYADPEELCELLRLVRRRDGVFAPHTRHHQNQWPARRPGQNVYGIYHGPPGEIIAGRYHGLLEAVELSRRAGGVRLHLAHLTPAFLVPQPHPAYLDEALAQATLETVIDGPAAEGLEVSFNVVSSPHSIGAELPILDSLPAALRSLGPEALARKLRSRGLRARLRRLIDSGQVKFGMIHPVTDPYWSDSYRVLRCAKKEYEGCTLWELARRREPDDTARAVYVGAVEALCDILADDPRATWALCRDKREDGVMQHFLRHPRGIPITDVHALPARPAPGAGIFNYGVSPTAYGAFPYFLRGRREEVAHPFPGGGRAQGERLPRPGGLRAGRPRRARARRPGGPRGAGFSGTLRARRLSPPRAAAARHRVRAGQRGGGLRPRPLHREPQRAARPQEGDRMKCSPRHQALIRRTFIDFQQTAEFLERPADLRPGRRPVPLGPGGQALLRRHRRHLRGGARASAAARPGGGAAADGAAHLRPAPARRSRRSPWTSWRSWARSRPGKLNFIKAFSGGSESIEAALKFARQYFQQTGHPQKSKFITNYLSYHGGTMAAMSASGGAKRKIKFEPHMPGFLKAFSPIQLRDRFSSWEETNRFCARLVEDIIVNENPETVAGVLIEPICNTGGIVTPTYGVLHRSCAKSRAATTCC